MTSEPTTSCVLEKEMNTFNGSGYESSEDSNDMLWESIKVDLDLNRANQTEQLQSLKGTVVKQPAKKQKVRKCHRDNKHNVKNCTKKKAFKRALEMLQAVTRNLKGKKKALSMKEDPSSSVMKFKVSDDIPQTVAPSFNTNQPKCKAKASSVFLKDQAIQTEDNKTKEEKISQTSCQANCNVHNCEEFYRQFFMRQSLACGMFFPAHATCCAGSIVNRCPCSSTHHALRWQQPTSSVTEKEVNSSSSQNIGSQYSLKEICEELLVQLSYREKSTDTLTGKNIIQNNNVLKNSIIPAYSASSDLGKLVDGLKSIQSDPRTRTSNEMRTPSGAYTSGTVTFSQATEPAQYKVLSSKEGPQPTTSSSVTPQMPLVMELASSSTVTPDLLQLASKIEQSFGRSDASTISKNQLLDTLHMNVLPPAGAGVTDTLIINSAVEEVIVDGLVKPLPTKTRFKSESAFIENAKERASEMSNTVQSTLTDMNNDSTNDPSCEGREVRVNVSATEALRSGKNVPIGLKSGSLSDRQSVSTKGCKEDYFDLTKEQGSKILARVQRIDDINIPERKVSNSPAFEEMDPTEMETLLLIWRQQEQLHQGDKEPETSAPSSPGFLFKKLKPPRELPPELRNIRILQPPPLKKSENPSALTLLDEETKKPTIEEDDEDIPESSPPVIPPPKRRKLRLTKNPPSPLPVVFQKNKQVALKIDPDPSSSQIDAEMTAPAQTAKPDGVSQCEKAVKQSMEVTNNSMETPSRPRISLRLKATAATAKERVTSISDEKSNCQDRRAKDIHCSESKQPKKINKKGEEKVNSPALTLGGHDENDVDIEEVETRNNDFIDQIKERVDNMAKRWLQQKSKDGIDINLDAASRRSSPAPSVMSECFQGLLFEKNMQKLSDISLHEIGKAHDMAVHIILNPWRGINARRVTRDFVCPYYDTKTVVRSLWDLRSGANSDDIVKRIISLGWKEVHPIALKALVSLFVLSLDRNVPFVIEAAVNGEEDDNSSTISDIDQCSKKKATSVRLVATKQIFKGECIEGLNGIFLKVSRKDKDKDKLKSWNFPKFGKDRNCVVFGPLAYLKRKEGNYNTEAVLMKNKIVAVRASRQILCGERLLVSFAQLETSI